MEDRSGVYEFQGFRFDASRRILTCADSPVPITPRLAELLSILLSRRPSIVGKRELIERLWPDAFVEEANLTVNVSALRRLLGESPRERAFIATVPGRGYQFVAPAVEIAPGEDVVIARRSRTRVVIEEEVAPETAPSLAVLPFRCAGAEADAYLGPGVADALVNAISRVRSVRVRSSSATAQWRGSAAEAAAAFAVDWVLEGLIQRSGDRLRVTVQLVRGRDGSVKWAGAYDEQFLDVFAVQDAIADNVTRSLGLFLTAEEKTLLQARPTANLEAYQLYLEGLHLTNAFSAAACAQAIDCFHRAIVIDPQYALAYAGLADAYCMSTHVEMDPRRALPRARSAALRALEIDPSLAEAHMALGLVAMWYEKKRAEASQRLTMAMRLKPELAMPRLWYAFHVASVGRFDEARRHAAEARKLDPMSPVIATMSGWIEYFARAYDAAERAFREAERLSPSFYAVFWGLGWVEIQRGNCEAALRHLDSALALSGGAAEVLAAIGHALACSGDRAGAVRRLDELHDMARRRYVPPFYCALVRVALGDRERALDDLEAACDDGFDWMGHLPVDPVWDVLRGHPRFDQLLLRVGQ